MTEFKIDADTLSSFSSDTADKPRLSGKMGASALTLTVLAFSAPIAVVEGFIPLAIMFGGPGAAFAFLMTTIVLILFAIGYVTMARHVPKPGDFYAFISTGLGKIPGLGSAFLAVFGYYCILTGTYIFFGVSVSSLITSMGGPETHWIAWSLCSWLMVSILGYFHIELSAKILSVAMVVEVIIVMIFNVFVLAKHGAEGLSIEPMTYHSFAKGDVAVTLLYTMLVFMGFEATALFRDEVKEPNKTIPRATYGAVIFIGLLYTLSSYALTSAYGAKAWEVAKTQPTEMFAHAIGAFVAPVFTQITYCSVIISLFAALLAIHNVLSRYILNLAVDKALPARLSKVHAKHCSPHAASIAVSTTVGISFIPAVMSHIDGGILYGIVVGIGSIGIIFLMGLVCVAIIAWFIKTGIPEQENLFKTIIAPAIAGLSLLATVLFAAMHLDVVVGGAPGENNWIDILLISVFILGAGIATYFKAYHPHVYKSLGRSDRMAEQ